MYSAYNTTMLATPATYTLQHLCMCKCEHIQNAHAISKARHLQPLTPTLSLGQLCRATSDPPALPALPGARASGLPRPAAQHLSKVPADLQATTRQARAHEVRQEGLGGGRGTGSEASTQKRSWWNDNGCLCGWLTTSGQSHR